MSPEVFDAIEALFDSEARIIGFDESTIVKFKNILTIMIVLFQILAILQKKHR